MKKNLFLFLFSFFGISYCYAQPANDNCTGAIALTSSTSGYNFISGTTTAATQSLAACSGTANDDVWYKFTATATEHTITVRPSATFDPTFQLFDVCGGTSLGCVNVNGPGAYEARSFASLTIGTEYVLRVYDWNLAAYEGTKGFEIALQTGNTILPVPAADWRWRGGTQTANAPGTYGSKGVASTSNVPPSRYNGANWIVNGNLWLFGGFGAGFYNDLWKYDTTATTWTWVSGDNTTAVRGVYGTQGTAAATNKPGARTNVASWKSANKLWLYGGSGYANVASSGSGYLGDLWQYDLTTNQWTWMNGSDNIGSNPVFGTTGTAAATNIPGGKSGFSSWTDAQGNFWLFGGLGYFTTNVNSEGYSNDLWKYDITLNQWTHVKGSKVKNDAGVYGTKGTSAAANLPRARSSAHTWTDNSGNLWLFGGETGLQAVGNDVWRYNIASNEWTWMSGDNSTTTINVYYGIKGVESAATNPGGRRYGMTFKDKNGKLWFVGGHRINTSFGNTRYMDAFILNPATGKFTWMSGSGDCCASASYGTLNVASASNSPGARFGSFNWSDDNGNFWLFGGSTTNNLNDLWSLKGIYPPPAPSTINISLTPICEGKSVTLSSTGTGTLRWYSQSSGGTVLGVGNSFITPTLSAATSYYVEDSTWTASITRTSVALTIVSKPVITISGATEICIGKQTSLTASGADFYTWDSGPNSPVFSVSPTVDASYVVHGVSSSTNCIGEASHAVTVNPLPTVSMSASAPEVCANGADVTLSGIPAGGTFSGNGVTSSSFDPAAASNGNNTITYTYTDANGCENTDSKTILVNELPVVSLTTSAASACANGAGITLGGIPAGGTFSGAGVTSSSFDPATAGSGTHAVTYSYTDANGCENTDSKSITVSTCTGINDAKSIPSFSLYPNPASSQFVVNGREGSVIKILQADGREIMHKNSMEGENIIDLEGFPQGVYLIVVQDAQGVKQEKLTVLK